MFYSYISVEYDFETYMYVEWGKILDWLDRENFVQRTQILRQLSYTLSKRYRFKVNTSFGSSHQHNTGYYFFCNGIIAILK